MTEPRLNARLMVDACLRQAGFAGRPAAILKRGDAEAGALFVKVYARDGRAALFAPSLTDAGGRTWRNVLAPDAATEAEADARIDKEARIDRDLWAVEVLDDDLANPLDAMTD